MREFKKKISKYAMNGQAFLFVLDFEGKKPFVCKLQKAKKHGIYYDIKGFKNFDDKKIKKKIKLKKYPIKKSAYKKQFKKVKKHLRQGNTYLLNLTNRTKIKTSLNLQEIFYISQAPYRLYFKGKFVVFSPECFIEIFDDKIFTYPMKGTIDGDLENAKEILLESKKELYEHNTIVDLMRNDLGMICEKVRVEKFRFVEHIKTNSGSIFQTSSKIVGDLKRDWKKSLGEDLLKLLPAGSISGAPKKKTLEIIKSVEPAKRGYYSGVFGIFDGQNLQSAIMIRYIEKEGKDYYFKSGGGITSKSKLKDEYDEFVQKIYIPTF